MYKEIIFGATSKIAIRELEEVVRKIESSNDNEFIIRRGRDWVETNVRKINAVCAIDSARGHKCHKAYVDWNVSLRALKVLIEPCLFPNGYKDGKFNIEMFGEL